jgi:hypothetical protein
MSFLVIVVQGMVPFLLIAWIASGRIRSRAGWYVTILITALWLVAGMLAGIWLALPWYFPRVLLVLLAFAGFRSWHSARQRNRLPARLTGRVGLVAMGAVAAILILLVVRVIAARRDVPADTVGLTFPLRGGTYLVASGGRSELLNAHARALHEPRMRAYRGQSYAVDIVEVGSWGSLDEPWRPRDPAAYAIFGRSIHSPCTGRVIRSHDGMPDMRPPVRDTTRFEGNHVIIACNDVWILLAHFARGSVRVRTGDAVADGDLLGSVGNSGNSSEPHLHIHAQRPHTLDEPFAGDPVSMRFGGRHLVRNDRVGDAP